MSRFAGVFFALVAIESASGWQQTGSAGNSGPERPYYTRATLWRPPLVMGIVAGVPNHATVADLLWKFAKIALLNPVLVPRLLAAGWRFRRRDWYRHPPFLPIPPQAYVEWRLHTAYGTGQGAPSATELRRYLKWLRWMNTTRTSGGDRS